MLRTQEIRRYSVPGMNDSGAKFSVEISQDSGEPVTQQDALMIVRSLVTTLEEAFPQHVEFEVSLKAVGRFSLTAYRGGRIMSVDQEGLPFLELIS